MCDCYRIGGPWIAEDPNCPTHGTEARIKSEETESLRTKIENATSFDELKDLMIELLNVIEN
jgi:hypothetical protein